MKSEEKTGPSTPDKQDGLRKWLSLHLRIVRQILLKKRPGGWSPSFRKYLYIDTHCGSGLAGPAGPGSPMIFLRCAAEAHMPHMSFFIDTEQANIECLKLRVSPLFRTDYGGETATTYTDGLSKATVLLGDNETVLPRIGQTLNKEAYGLIYIDPYGRVSKGLLAAVGDMVRRLTRVDVLIRIPARAYKRVRGAGHDDRRLTEIFQAIPKQYWIVREPLTRDSMDWLFLYGANYRHGDWKKVRFHDIESEEGSEILLKADCCKEHLEELIAKRQEETARVKARSEGVCEKCRSRKATQIHHRCYDVEYRATDMMHVCFHCHCELHGIKTRRSA